MAYYSVWGKVKKTSGYGWRTLNGKKSFHRGVDFVGLESKEQHIDEKKPATIKYAGWDTFSGSVSGGWMVWWKYDDGSGGYVLHCKELRVKTGQRVDHNTVIAIEGESGNAYGVHTHQGKLKNADDLNSHIDPNLQEHPLNINSNNMGLVKFKSLNKEAQRILRIGRPDLNNVDLTNWIAGWSGYDSMPGFVEVVEKLSQIGRPDVLKYIKNGGDLGAWMNDSMVKEYKDGFWNAKVPTQPTDKIKQLKAELTNILNKY